MQRTASYTRNIQGASFCGEKSKPGSPGVCYNQSEHRFTNQSTGREKMPRTEESNQRIREEQTHKIMVAATKVFARKELTDFFRPLWSMNGVPLKARVIVVVI
jgi:hypothetical protein